MRLHWTALTKKKTVEAHGVPQHSKSLTLTPFQLNHQPSLSCEHQRFIKCYNYFLQALYDPYLTWRNFLRGDVANYAKLGYKISPLHPEIVPFIYDCFQAKGICKHPDVGKELFHILGAVIAGSQVGISALFLFLVVGRHIYIIYRVVLVSLFFDLRI